MTRSGSLAIVALVAAFAVVPAARADAGSRQTPDLAALAAKASPDLVSQLSKELGSTPEQAAGAAGALFGLAKSRLKAGDFSKVSKAVPGMDALLKAAPVLAAAGGGSAVSQMAGAAGGLASMAGAFSKLGLSPELVAKAIPVLTSFVTKGGGANVGKLLAGVLK